MSSVTELCATVDRSRPTATPGQSLACCAGVAKSSPGQRAETEYERLFVQYLWVTSSLRGQGLGSHALTRLEETAHREGCRDSLIETLDERVFRLYVRLGYRELALVKGYVGPFNRHILLKPLGVWPSGA